jgi:molybdopterin synthase catalytic subunit
VSVALSARPIDPAQAHRALADPGAGGIVVFVGRVRPDRTAKGVVRALRYEADRPMALRIFAEIEAAAERRAGVRRVVVWHRVGTLVVGEVAVVVGAAAVHRDEAFRAARFLIERVKRDAPIWKTDRARPGRPRPRRPARRPARSADSGRAQTPQGPRRSAG